MKKLIASLTVFSCIAGLCSCGENTPPESSQRVSTAPIDPEIIGTWANDTSGYRFGENRKVTLTMDFSERGHFTSDGAFQTLNALIPANNVNYDGSRLYCTVSNYSDEYQEQVTSVLIDMERKDEPDMNTFDGEYKIYGGIATDLIARDLGIATKHLNFEGKIEGEKLYISIIDVFDFETVDGNLDLFSEYLVYSDESADCLRYSYTIQNDTLTMIYGTDGSASPEVYTRSQNES